MRGCNLIRQRETVVWWVFLGLSGEITAHLNPLRWRSTAVATSPASRLLTAGPWTWTHFKQKLFFTLSSLYPVSSTKKVNFIDKLFLCKEWLINVFLWNPVTVIYTSSRHYCWTVYRSMRILYSGQGGLNAAMVNNIFLPNKTNQIFFFMSIRKLFRGQKKPHKKTNDKGGKLGWK